MISFKQIIGISICLAFLVASVASGKEKEAERKHSVLVNEAVKAPKLDLEVDGQHVEATYYDETIDGEIYTQPRRDFDKRLVTALTELAHKFCYDVVIKNKMTVTLSLYVGSLTKLVATYLPEFSRTVKAGGPKIKDTFIGDAVSIWKGIMNNLSSPDKKEKYISAMPKDGPEFMQQIDNMLDTIRLTVENSPVGIYIDWRIVKIDDKSMADIGAPLVAYLQSHGYSSAISILNTIMNILASIKSTS